MIRKFNKPTPEEIEARRKMSDAAEKLGLSWEKYNKFDWYFTLNMIASDYAGIVEDVKFVEIAKAWLEDKDVPEGKALRYWWKVVKCNK